MVRNNYRTLTSYLHCWRCIIFALFIPLLFTACIPTPEIWENGTLKVNITGADEHNGKYFRYTATTWLPADKRSLEDEASIAGAIQITGGGVSFFIKDPENPESNYIFKGNNVVDFYGYIDVSNSGTEEGGIDMTLDEMLSSFRSININGNIVIDARYPDDFHLSESGSPGFWIGSDAGGFARDADKDLGTISGGTTDTVECSIQNTGIALLTLTGTPFVSFIGTDSTYFSVPAQPASGSIVPGDSVPFTFAVDAPAESGTYSAVLTIPFDDTLYEPGDESPFTATISFTVP